MVKIKREGIILESSGLDFENQAVLNPTCIQEGNSVHMFYRAVRNGNQSSIGYCKLEGPLKVVERSENPVLFPELDYEKQGLEDPRIVYMDGIYYLFYTVFDGKNALAAYATSKDLKNWVKKSPITANILYSEAEQIFRDGKSKLKERYFFFESYIKETVADDVMLWEKDVFMFPEKINNKYALVHRILPDIQIAYFDDFSELNTGYWKEYLKRLGNRIILEPEHGYESRNIGGGAVPIKTKEGWLLIYHAVEDSNSGKVYHASAALLDLNDPQKVLGRLEKPLFSPREDYEKFGDVNNVIFPTGTAIFDDRLYIYYGAADKRIAAVSLNLNELLDELLGRVNEGNLACDVASIRSLIVNVSKEGISLEKLASAVNKDEKIILVAVGWLLKEGKVHCTETGGQLIITSE